MPTLPIIDLLILLGWTVFSIGGVLKAVYITTSYRPTLAGLAPMDCVVLAGCFLMFAVALAARTWVKAHEPRMLAERRSRSAARRAEAIAERTGRGGGSGVGAAEAPGDGVPVEPIAVSR